MRGVGSEYLYLERQYRVTEYSVLQHCLGAANPPHRQPHSEAQQAKPLTVTGALLPAKSPRRAASAGASDVINLILRDAMQLCRSPTQIRR